MSIIQKITINPDPEIRHLMGIAVLEDDLVAVMDYKVDIE
jgi:hypothetical protein